MRESMEYMIKEMGINSINNQHECVSLRQQWTLSILNYFFVNNYVNFSKDGKIELCAVI